MRRETAAPPLHPAGSRLHCLAIAGSALSLAGVGAPLGTPRSRALPAVLNNVGGADRDVLARLGEPAWNDPVMRFLAGVPWLSPRQRAALAAP